MCSFDKLLADTVLCTHSKNMWFVCHVGSFMKMSSSAVELQPAPSSYKSKVCKDFGFKVFYAGQGVRHFSLYSCYFLPFVNCYKWKLKIPKQFSNITSLGSCML